MLLKRIAGAFRFPPADIHGGLSDKAAALVDRAFEGIKPGHLVDYHTHLLGIGSGDTGCFVNPRMRSLLHPLLLLTFKTFMHSAGIMDQANTDREYIERVVDLVRAIPNHGLYNLLAFDQYYELDGTVNLQRTHMHVPNDYVFNLAREYPGIFLPTMSVHPYRKDAVEELEKWQTLGGQFVKWLPNAMGIDPGHERCSYFYEAMRVLDLTLISHGGDEKALGHGVDQSLGNPLLLRAPLNTGVRVVMAHCGGLGKNKDLDDPAGKRIPNFDLFMRLMKDKKYEGRLFGDISAMTQFNRLGKPLETIIIDESLHPRLINGSDYPLPAANFLVSTRALVKKGFLSAEERLLINEVYQYNPLLFDYVLKRTVHAPGTGKRLPAYIFQLHPDLTEWQEIF